jgi:hypothetical protein
MCLSARKQCLPADCRWGHVGKKCIAV